MSQTERTKINQKLDDALREVARLLDNNNVVMDNGLVARDERLDAAFYSLQASLLKSKSSLS